MKDIETRADIEHLLSDFYTAATVDTQIGHHFADLDLATHLPTIADFWEKILFGNPVYFGNPLEIHRQINEKSPLTLEDFRRWIEIFTETIDRLFTGEQTENAKLRARMIAHSLNQRINRESSLKIVRV